MITMTTRLATRIRSTSDSTPSTKSPSPTSAEGLEGDQGKGVLHAGQRLDLAGDEMADVGLVVEIALHQEVVLAGGRIDLGDLLDAASIVGHVVGPTELAFQHDEDRLHGSPSPRDPL